MNVLAVSARAGDLDKEMANAACLLCRGSDGRIEDFSPPFLSMFYNILAK